MSCASISFSWSGTARRAAATGFPHVRNILGVAMLMVGLNGCFVMRPSSGGGQTSFRPPRKINVADIALAPGYRIEPVATGLNMPTGVAFDGAGDAYVTESGYSYGEVWATPRLLRIGPSGTKSVIATGALHG